MSGAETDTGDDSSPGLDNADAVCSVTRNTKLITFTNNMNDVILYYKVSK